MATFRVLHIADLHIGQQPDMLGFPEQLTTHLASHDPQTAEAVVQFAQALAHTDGLDAIVIAGDLSCSGLKPDLDTAFAFTQELAAVAPVVLLPGNHDRYADTDHSPGGRVFDSVFGSYWSAGLYGTQVMRRFGNAPGEMLSLVGVDLCLAPTDITDTDLLRGGPWAKMGCGAVRGPALGALRQTTENEAAAGYAVAWVTHFAPSFPDGSATLDLIGSDSLANAARLSSVGHIFCGHTHDPREYEAPGDPKRPVWVHCAGSATEVGAKSGFGQGVKENWIHPVQITVEGGTITNVSWHRCRYDGHIFE